MSCDFFGTAKPFSIWITDHLMFLPIHYPYQATTNIVTYGSFSCLDHMSPFGKLKNNLGFNDRGVSAAYTVSLAIASAREWKSNQTHALATPQNATTSTPPQHDCLLIRSDAAWNDLQKVAGLCWTIKGQNRVSSFAMASHFVASPLIAEGLTFREAVMKCSNLGLGLPHIRCKSDSAQLIKALHS